MYYSLNVTKKRINNVSNKEVNFTAYNYINLRELVDNIEKKSDSTILWFEHLNDLKKINSKSLLRFKKIIVWDGIGLALGKNLTNLHNLLVVTVDDTINNSLKHDKSFNFGSYLQSINSIKPNKGVVDRTIFYGGLHLRKGYHCNRINILYDALKLKPNIELYLPSYSLYKDVIYCLLRPTYIKLFIKKLLLYRHNRGIISTIDLRNMKGIIVINIHIDNAKEYAVNLRILEALNFGIPIITNSYTNGDWSKGELLTFQTATDLVETIDKLLGSKEEQREIIEHYRKLWNRRGRDFLFETKLLRLTEYIQAEERISK